MPVNDQSALGCSKCRFSRRGCKRCKDPAFQKRERDSEPCGGPAKRRKRKHSGVTAAAASSSSIQKEEQLHAAPQPAGIQGSTAEPTSQIAERKASASASPIPQLHQQTSKAPPPDSSTAPAGSSPFHTGPAATQQQSAVCDNTSSHAAGAAAPSTCPTALKDNAASGEADTAETSVPVDNAASQHTNPAATTNASHADYITGASSERPTTSSQAGSEGTASDSRPSFLLMLQSKMEQRRQQRRESQSASDSSLSSVHGAGVSSAEKAEGSITSGTQAPQAMTVPRHKVKQQRRRSTKKPAKTRGFLQAGGDPRRALWHPPVSPYGLLEEVLYEDPWKLLVACMLLNVTSGLQVRKVIWRLFAIWPTAEAAAGASDDTLVIVEKLIQPLGLFRKRTLAIKRFSQDYLAAQWLDPIELHGIGQYASDAYFMFCRGNWQEVEPTDKDLLKYQQWLQSTGGEGTGLERDVMPVVCGEGAGPGSNLDGQ